MSDVILLPGPKLKGAYVQRQVVVEKNSAAIITAEMGRDPEIKNAVDLELLVSEEYDPTKVRTERDGKKVTTFYGEIKIGWERFDVFEKPKVDKKKRPWGTPIF